MLFNSVLLVSVLCLVWYGGQFFVAAQLPQSEVDALNRITKALGATNLTFTVDTACGFTDASSKTESNVSINCITLNRTSHISDITIKRWNLQGVLPSELVQLPHLQHIDFAYNYLKGSIPVEWVSMQLKFISVFVNRLSGNIPSHLGSITSLTYLDLQANHFSGTVPAELGKLVNLEELRLSSNQLSGNLPIELAKLKNLTQFWISDNNFSGSIPDFIQNWKQLRRLYIQGSGLKGPIPSSISALESLEQLRISDVNGTNQAFPDLANLTTLTRIILRNCNISGEIPRYIWEKNKLRILDLSFNNLTGELLNFPITDSLKFIFLSGNSLSGNIQESILKRGTVVDLSYNNFTWPSSEQAACREASNIYLNLFRSSPVNNNLSGILPCKNNLKCERYRHSFYINCGGQNMKVNGSTFEGDGGNDGGAATYYLNDAANWGFSSTGDFTDDNDEQNRRYIADSNSPLLSNLYKNARIAPLSLTYFGYCLANRNYLVTLHFAEIIFTDDNTYNSLGRRIFDIYIQDKLVEKDFNIEAEASGVLKAISKPYNVTVANNILEIRFNWAGKGTTAIPRNGVYGPLVSAISVVDPNFKPGKKSIASVVGGVVAGICIIVLVLGYLCRKYYIRAKSEKQTDFKGLDLQTNSFTLKQIKAATNNFDSENKIGEGGFGPVFKGLLSDGTIIAVKQLSSKSKQGNREFLNEIGMISCLQHPNLVKLYGCCIEGDQLLLVYEYMENNSLARALFGHEQSQLKLDWSTRQKICLGIAKGLAFLHEESRFKIVHRDIKATNILLDGDLNPKISDFGLAKLDEEENTHISTRVAGTIGYMAPEYALWGYLTYKADVYSFGVVALEIVSGKNNMSYLPDEKCACLLDWACHVQQNGKLKELVDPKLGSEYKEEETERMIKVSLLCTNASPSLRPTMSEVVGMLEGATQIPDAIPEAGSYSQDLRFKAIRDQRRLMDNQSLLGSQAVHSTLVGSSTSGQDLYEVNEESYLRYKVMRDGYAQIDNESSVSELQLSTSIPSWTGSSTSGRDLYSNNLSSK